MKFTAKKVRVHDYRETNTPLDKPCDYDTIGFATVEYEVVLEAREWGLKSFTVLITKITAELEHDHIQTAEITNEKFETTDAESDITVTEGGEFLTLEEVNLHDGRTEVLINMGV